MALLLCVQQEGRGNWKCIAAKMLFGPLHTSWMQHKMNNWKHVVWHCKQNGIALSSNRLETLENCSGSYCLSHWFFMMYDSVLIEFAWCLNELIQRWCNCTKKERASLHFLVCSYGQLRRNIVNYDISYGINNNDLTSLRSFITIDNGCVVRNISKKNEWNFSERWFTQGLRKQNSLPMVANLF